jgi:hypothetical protein
MEHGLYLIIKLFHFMREYNVNSEKGRRYRAFEGEREIGLLSNAKWYSSNAEVDFSDLRKLQIISKGVLNSKMIVKQNDKQIAEYKMTWNKGIAIDSEYGNFMLQAKGIFKSGFVLVNEQNELLLTIDYSFVWKSFANNFTIKTTESFEKIIDKDVIVMIVLAATNYYLTIIAAAAA